MAKIAAFMNEQKLGTLEDGTPSPFRWAPMSPGASSTRTATEES
jgi:hypothetical protein